MTENMPTFLQSELNEALLEGTAGLIAREDTGEIIYATCLLEQMFGYHMRGELSVGMSVEDLLPHNLREKHKTVHRPAYKEKPHARPMGVGMNLEGQRKDGTVFPLAVSLRGRVISGIRCVIAIVTDMTNWGRIT